MAQPRVPANESPAPAVAPAINRPCAGIVVASPAMCRSMICPPSLPEKSTTGWFAVVKAPTILEPRSLRVPMPRIVIVTLPNPPASMEVVTRYVPWGNTTVAPLPVARAAVNAALIAAASSVAPSPCAPNSMTLMTPPGAAFTKYVSVARRRMFSVTSRSDHANIAAGSAEAGIGRMG